MPPQASFEMISLRESVQDGVTERDEVEELEVESSLSVTEEREECDESSF